MDEFMVDDLAAERAGKGDHMTLRLDFKLRPADKVYKVEATSYAAPSASRERTDTEEDGSCPVCG